MDLDSQGIPLLSLSLTPPTNICWAPTWCRHCDTGCIELRHSSTLRGLQVNTETEILLEDTCNALVGERSEQRSNSLLTDSRAAQRHVSCSVHLRRAGPCHPLSKNAWLYLLLWQGCGFVARFTLQHGLIYIRKQIYRAILSNSKPTGCLVRSC